MIKPGQSDLLTLGVIADQQKIGGAPYWPGS
jgi:hypothetical protein